MAFEPDENLDLREYGILADGGTSITAWFPVAEREISDLGLTPGNTLPQQTTVDDAGEAGIVGGRYKNLAGMRYAVITAHLPAYYQAVQTRSGTATSAATTITSDDDAPIFYPSLVGQTITFNAPATYVVATYVSPTEITVTLTAGNQAAEDISFPEGSRLLTEASTDEFQWTRAGWWTVVRRWLCETEDREAEMIYLKTQTFTFDAADNSVVGRASGGSSRGRSPTYPHKALIVMAYEAPIYDV